MKNIYQANNIDEATRFLQIFEDKWKDKYMYFKLSVFFILKQKIKIIFH
ncbi:hypothetical protein O7984_03155 [Mycoplasmopsis felis]|nr:hypothetical protein [Mycoplasmopsis felis]WRX06498.1 hypothetical protein O7984_03155 [Mycoplasmopsis felis]